MYDHARRFKISEPIHRFLFPKYIFHKIGNLHQIRDKKTKSNHAGNTNAKPRNGIQCEVSAHLSLNIRIPHLISNVCPRATHTQSPHNVCCIARSASATWSLTLKILFQTRSGHGLQDYDDFPNGALLGNTRDWPTYAKYSGRIICISVFDRSVSKGYVRALPRLPNSGRGHRRTEIVFGNQIPGARPCIQMQVFRTYS